MRTRVVVTGMGVVAPNAIGVDAFIDALLAGTSGVGPITCFDATGLPTRIAGEVRTDLPSPLSDRKIAFLLAAANEAWAHACKGGTRLTETAESCAASGSSFFGWRIWSPKISRISRCRWRDETGSPSCKRLRTSRSIS